MPSRGSSRFGAERTAFVSRLGDEISKPLPSRMLRGQRIQDREIVVGPVPVDLGGRLQGVQQVVADLDEPAEDPSEPLQRLDQLGRRATEQGADLEGRAEQGRSLP